MSVMMQLGSFQFSIDSAAYQELTRNTDYRWPKADRVGKAPARQFTGVGDDTIDLAGVIVPHWRGGLNQLDDIRKLAGSGKPLRAVAMPSIGIGEDLGLWCIERIEEGQSRFLKGGIPARQSFRIRISAYGDET